MMKEKKPLINGGQKLFELNQFRFAAGRKLVQNNTNIITVLTIKQRLRVYVPTHKRTDAQCYLASLCHFKASFLYVVKV